MIPAVVSGNAFALTASVDRNAMAKVNDKDVKAVVNLDERANIYLMARKAGRRRYSSCSASIATSS